MATRQILTLACILASIIRHGSASSVESSIECDTEIEVDSKASLLLQARKSQREDSISAPMHHHRNRHDPISSFFMSRATAEATPTDMNPVFDELEAHLLEKLGTLEGMEGHTEDSGMQINQTLQYDHWAQSGLNSICETGFNAGHSALRFLYQSTARLYEFDLGEHGYAKVAADYLQTKYPNRLTVVWGDTTASMPAFRSNHSDVKCDLMIVDGGHAEFIAKNDLVNFALMANPNAIIAIDDTPCAPAWCQGPQSAWDELVQHGCITTTEALPMGQARGFTYGQFTPCSYVSEFFAQ